MKACGVPNKTPRLVPENHASNSMTPEEGKYGGGRLLSTSIQFGYFVSGSKMLKMGLGYNRYKKMLSAEVGHFLKEVSNLG